MAWTEDKSTNWLGGEDPMKLAYEAPVIVDHGSIADHTFNNPGVGDKAPEPMATDKFGEFSHPSP